MRCLRIDWISHDRTLRLTCAQRSEALRKAWLTMRLQHPSTQCAKPRSGRIYISEVQRHQARYRKLIQFTSSSTKAAGAMLLAAIAALVVANSPVSDAFSHFWHTDVGFVFGQTQATMPLSHVINDVLMAVFFLLVGLEIKYEMTVGELTNIRQAIASHRRCGGRCARACGRLLRVQRGQP